MYKNIVTQRLTNPLFGSRGLKADTLRLDLMHPIISGNKWFKLKNYLPAARVQGKTSLVSVGGAYSNHLIALAFLCREQGWKCTGIVRGEEPDEYGPSLLQMRSLGMNLLFVSRESYRYKEDLITSFLAAHPDHFYIPEGGQGPEGIAGAAEILQLCEKEYSHILCACGTATTLTGLINGSTTDQQITGVPVLKPTDPGDNELLHFVRQHSNKTNYELCFGYHFGGYAKRSSDLTAFMNTLYREENIPTDFVYTGKLFYAVHDLVKKARFSPGDHLLVIHSGGLQGNRSLPPGLLCF